jgi:membrane-associated phospholipid phosphatase
MGRRQVGLVLWLVVLAGVEAVGLYMVWRFFVRTVHGQLLDFVALSGNRIGRSRIESLVNNILGTVSILSVAVAAAVIGFIALTRRRIAVAAGALLLIAGANLTAFLLKQAIYRPQLGVDVQRSAAGNSLPSGHTTLAASVAVALMLVLPAGVRGVSALLGAVAAAAVGVATLSAGWHRPSDAVAALLIVGVWACVAGLFIVLAQRSPAGTDHSGSAAFHASGPGPVAGRGPTNWFAVSALAVAGVLLLAGAAVALRLTDQVLSTPVSELGRRRLLAAYGGGALGIAGVASLVVALVLATAHRVVPQAVAPPASPSSFGADNG